MFSELKKYKNKGHFFYEKGMNLKELSKTVPNLSGVFYILKLAKGKISISYISQSGIENKGLNESINGLQNGINRQEYFDHKISKENIDALDIYWFVTIDKQNNDLPTFVEGLIMQTFYKLNGKPPEWNKG